MTKAQDSAKLVSLFEALSDVTLTVVADFVSDTACGGMTVAVHLAQTGVTVFPVGVVGEDEPGQRVIQALHQQRISTSGISRIKNYATPSAANGEMLHEEHPALLNVIEHTRKLATAADGMYVCDYGIGAASPRVLNFIKSNGCMREKALVARSLQRLPDFEQLTAAVASRAELERAIGIAIGDDEQKLAVASHGMMQEVHASAVLAVDNGYSLLVSKGRKPARLTISSPSTGRAIDLAGAFFASALAADAEARDAAELATRLAGLFASQASGARLGRDSLIDFLSSASTANRVL